MSKTSALLQKTTLQKRIEVIQILQILLKEFCTLGPRSIPLRHFYTYAYVVYPFYCVYFFTIFKWKPRISPQTTRAARIGIRQIDIQISIYIWKDLPQSS
jgi:hypothetical protein